jgi:hypothetical protein
MIAAYILAGELHRSHGDYRVAFQRYQDLFAPFVLKKQQAALRFAGYFAPRSKLSLFVRNQVMNLLRIPWGCRPCGRQRLCGQNRNPTILNIAATDRLDRQDYAGGTITNPANHLRLPSSTLPKLRHAFWSRYSETQNVCAVATRSYRYPIGV